MLRTSIREALFATLLAACGEDKVCHLDACGNQVCTNFQTDPMNCGGCGVTCTDTQTCSGGQCTDNIPACAAPMTQCGSDCVDTQTAAAHCGSCDNACTTGITCVTGGCAVPLVAMQTSINDRATDRDLFVLQDRTFALAQLNSSTFLTSRVVDHAILPDGRVVFVAAPDTEGVFELYLAAPGGAPTKLSAALVTGGNVHDGLVVHGTTVFYRADQDVVGEINLYAVDVGTPGTAVQINGPLIAGGRVSRVVAASADGTRVVYVATEDSLTQDDAFVVDVATPGTALNLTSGAFQGVSDLQLAPDGSRIVARGNDLVTGNFTLSVIDVANPGVAIPVGNSIDPNYTPGDVYLIVGNALFYTGSSLFLEDSLWRVDLTQATLDSTQLVDGTLGDVRRDIAVTADGQHVFYRQLSNVTHLFRVDVANPATPTLLSLPGTNQFVAAADFALTRDEKHVVFRAGSDGAEGGFTTQGIQDPPPVDFTLAPELDSIDLTTMSAPVRLAVDGNEGVDAGYIALDDGRVVFRADTDVLGQSDAWVVGLDAAPVKVSPPLNTSTVDSTDVSVLTRF